MWEPAAAVLALPITLCPFGRARPHQARGSRGYFEDKLKSSLNGLSKKHKEKVDLGKTGKNGLPERAYIGFEAYKEAISNLDKGDVAIFTTPPASAGCSTNTPWSGASMCSWKNR